MERRNFIVLVGSLAVFLPYAARGQQGGRRPLIGWITGSAAPGLEPLVAAFRTRLSELGWQDGRDVTIDVHPAAGDFARLDADAGTLVAAGASVILAVGTPGLKAVQHHSRTVPVVFVMVADPVGQRLVDNLAHPGGHATGLTNFEFAISGKWLELLKEMSPNVTHTTLITNPANDSAPRYMPALVAASRARGVEVTPASVSNADEIRSAIERTVKRPAGSLIVFPDSLANVHRELIVGLAERERLPTIYPFRDFALAGGLMSYGLNFADVYRQAAEYVDKILRGQKPADLPVQAPNKFELVINLKAAKAIGIAVPQAMQVAADEVIE